jgi:hypothetical protein
MYNRNPPSATTAITKIAVGKTMSAMTTLSFVVVARAQFDAGNLGFLRQSAVRLRQHTRVLGDQLLNGKGLNFFPPTQPHSRTQKRARCVLGTVPLAPMGRVRQNGLHGFGVDPAGESTAARKRERVSAVVVNDGQFQIAIKRRRS